MCVGSIHGGIEPKIYKDFEIYAFICFHMQYILSCALKYMHCLYAKLF